MIAKTTLELPPYKKHPRNSEGTFAELSDGRILFIYSCYTGDSFHDDSPCNLAARYSKDQGRTWSSEDRLIVLHGDALNVMSPSLLHLQDGRLALLYLKKFRSAQCGVECRPYIIFSEDDGESWSEPGDSFIRFNGYQVVNNDRMIQLKSGRLVVPVAFHRPISPERHDTRSLVLMYLSDDGGKTWREGTDWILPPQHTLSGLQEPGVLELESGKLLGWARSSDGMQYMFFSPDGGDHWSAAAPSEFRSPNSPMSMKRDPETGIIHALWNDHSERWSHLPRREECSRQRTPFVMARSLDNGATWQNHELMGSDPKTGYCYTGMFFTRDRGLLLSFCCGGPNCHILQKTRICRIELITSSEQ